MTDFFISSATSETVWIVILLTGVVTYFTRSGGYMVVSRFKQLHPRFEAALEAVPGAVLVTLVLPPVLTSGLLEVIAMGAGLIASFRMSPIIVITIGMIIVIVGRSAGF